MKAWLAGICLFSVILGSSFAAEDSLDKVVVNSAVSLVDERLDSVLKTLEALAGCSEALSADWESLEPVLKKLQDGGLAGVVWFALPDGTYYTVEKGLQEQKLSDRPYFPRLLDGERTVGDLVTSRSTGRSVVVAAVPILKKGTVVGALGASLYLDDLSKAIYSCIGVPADVSFIAVNGDGKVALDRDPKKIMTDHPVSNDAADATSALTGWRFVIVSE